MENEFKGLESVSEIVEEKDENGNDITNWQEIAMAQNKFAKQYEGLAKRNYNDLKKIKEDPRLKVEAPNPAAPKKEDNKGFDYGELSYLEVKGVSNQEDQDWLQGIAKQSNLQLRELLAKDWVQKELKERNDGRVADKAIPSGTKRSQGGTATTEDTVEYWVAQDKQPPESKPLAFRKQVLEARNKKSIDDDKFSKSSIVAPGYPL